MWMISPKNAIEFENMKKLLVLRFKMKDLAIGKQFLGINI